MTILKYSDLTGYGMVQAPTISIYLRGPVMDKPVDPICMIGKLGTLHFGLNIALFEMEK
ncbi:hypothetical protein LCGC14_2732810 [marine sediment metagenome]|uniref:Uncharacterized protein n=1 Tax=marine sediment metagenome TaxID=412755 RepID=A0A0F8Z6U3_9ZZZZ